MAKHSDYITRLTSSGRHGHTFLDKNKGFINRYRV